MKNNRKREGPWNDTEYYQRALGRYIVDINLILREQIYIYAELLIGVLLRRKTKTESLNPHINS